MMLKQGVLLGLGLLVAQFTWADAFFDLAKTKNCMACHAINKKVVGPSFQNIAQKYANQKEMQDKLVQKVRRGGGGVWGVVPMPANSQVSDDEARQLVTGILSLKQ